MELQVHFIPLVFLYMIPSYLTLYFQLLEEHAPSPSSQDHQEESDCVPSPSDADLAGHQQDEDLNFHRDPTCPPSTLSDKESKSGSLLYLRETFYLPYEALEYVDTTLEEYAERKVEALKVICHASLLFFIIVTAILTSDTFFFYRSKCC